MIYEIVVVVVSVAFVVLVIYTICTLVQIKKTAREAEQLFAETRGMASRTRQLFRDASVGMRVLGAWGGRCGALRALAPLVKGDLVNLVVYLSAVAKGLGVGLSVLRKESEKGGDDHG